MWYYSYFIMFHTPCFKETVPIWFSLGFNDDIKNVGHERVWWSWRLKIIFKDLRCWIDVFYFKIFAPLRRNTQNFCVLPLKLSSDQGKYIFISLFKPSEHDLHAILFYFAIKLRLANFEKEDYKNIKKLYACSTKGREVIGNCIL